ncbi:MAG: chemotaxis-specific protein-glutamate methyltransferase CheB [Vulcanimicrobiota bacterium]
MPDRQLRVLIVDDSVSFRTVLAKVCNDMEGVEVVGSAHNGRAALEKAVILRPDLVTLDIDMPEMDGLEVLHLMKSAVPAASCVMITSISARNAELTLKALNLGALDLIIKPSGPDMEANYRELSRQMRALIRILITKKHVFNILEDRDRVEAVSPLPVVSPQLKTGGKEAVAIAISTGGPAALNILIPSIPGNLRVPLFIVQHMPVGFTGFLAESLNKKSALNVKEAESGESVKAGTAYVAPGGKQMKVDLHPVSREKIILITDAPPENFCRPSADYLFRSLASIYGEKVMAIIMTGMGDDGVKGLRALKNTGAHVIAQDEATSVVFGMARMAIEAEVVDSVLPLGRIAGAIIAHTRNGWD